MILEVFLPSVLFLIAITVIFFYSKLENKVDSLFGEKELRIEHIILLVVAMGVTITVLVFISEVAMMGLYLFAYSMALFLFSYLLAPKWYLAVPTPVLFIALYFSPYWNIYLFNFFAIIFSVCISVYMGSLFTWKTTAGFVSLLTVVDVIQVLITGFMVAAAEKALGLGLPVAIILPAFPSEGWTILGLGDVFLVGLLSIQTTKKYGRKFGIASIASITVVFLLLQTILLNTGIASFPGTVLIISGWLTSLGLRQLNKSRVENKGRNFDAREEMKKESPQGPDLTL